MDADMDPELKKFLEGESLKAQFHAQAMQLTNMCWDKCIDKIGNKTIGNGSDSRTDACLANCVERFMESSAYIIGRWNSNAASGNG